MNVQVEQSRDGLLYESLAFTNKCNDEKWQITRTFIIPFIMQPLIYTQQEVLSEMELNWQAIQVSLAYYTGYTIQSYYKDTLNRPDERQLLRGIQSTEVPKRLSRIVDTLVLETGKYQDIEESPPALDWFLSQGLPSYRFKRVYLI